MYMYMYMYRYRFEMFKCMHMYMRMYLHMYMYMYMYIPTHVAWLDSSIPVEWQSLIPSYLLASFLLYEQPLVTCVFSTYWIIEYGFVQKRAEKGVYPGLPQFMAIFRRKILINHRILGSPLKILVRANCQGHCQQDLVARVIDWSRSPGCSSWLHVLRSLDSRSRACI